MDKNKQANVHSLSYFGTISAGDKMTKNISFIHAADLHLDSPFQGLSHIPDHIFQHVQESTFIALDRLVQVAIDQQVDFVLLVGDLFDHELQSLKALIRLRNGCEQLQRANIPVFMSYGNHDHLQGHIHRVTYPDNVFIFPDEKVRSFVYEKNGQPLASIYGFSYEQQAVLDHKVTEYQIVNHQTPFHIATLHGSIQSNTDHDTYAPFKLSELTAKEFDYWALGHIHQRQILHRDPFVVYPGNIQGRHRNEQGQKGCYYVQLSEVSTEMTFIPLQALTFSSLTVDLSSCQEIHQVEKHIQHALAENKATKPTLFDLTLLSEREEHLTWEVNQYFDEIIDLINEGNVQLDDWQYIYHYQFQHTPLDASSLPMGDHFIGELISNIEETSLQQILDELFHHRQGRKFLFPLNEQEEQMIKQRAAHLLVDELLNTRR